MVRGNHPCQKDFCIPRGTPVGNRLYWQPAQGKLQQPAFTGNTMLDKVPLGKTALLSLQDLPSLSNPTSSEKIRFLNSPTVLDGGYRRPQLQASNRCRLALKLIFLSDIATACSLFLDKHLVLDPILPDGKVLQFTFPNKQPPCTDCKLWLEFWTAFSGPGGSFLILLEKWQFLTHRCWKWFYYIRMTNYSTIPTRLK